MSEDAPQAPTPASGRNRLVIGLTLAAAAVVILNETTMANALRPLMLDLGIDERAGQWLTTAFMLTMAVVIPMSGWIIERFTTRTVFIGAMGVFCAGTAIAIAAPTFGVLLFARIVQACGTAVMLPLLMTSILTLVPLAHRGAVMGNVSIVISLAPALGPAASGLILGAFGSWRAIFAVMLPIALAMLLLGALKMVNIGESNPVNLDLLSIPLAVFGFGGLVYALTQIGESSGSGSAVWISAIVGVIGTGLFVARQYQLQRTTGQPLLDLRTFTHRRFTLGVSVVVIAFAALMGAAILLPLYLQGARGMPPLTAGLVVLPGGILMGIGGRIVGQAFDRVGPRVLAVPGVLLIAGSMFGLGQLNATTPIWLIVTVYTLLAIGLALVFTPMITTALNDLPPPLYPHGSAWLGSLQQVGGAAGIALLVTYATVVAARTAASGSDSAATIPQIAGLDAAMVLGGVITLVALPLVLAIGKRKPAEPHTDGDTEFSSSPTAG